MSSGKGGHCYFKLPSLLIACIVKSITLLSILYVKQIKAGISFTDTCAKECNVNVRHTREFYEVPLYDFPIP